jgi:cardiolipin synthase
MWKSEKGKKSCCRFLLSALVALGRRLAAAESLTLTSQCDLDTNAAATMIPLHVAKARIPPLTIAALSDTSLSLRSLLQRSQNRQTLYPVYSRASCSWTRNDVARPNRLCLNSRPYKQCSIRSTSLFSTSTTRRLKLEDEANSSKTSTDDVEVGRVFILKIVRFVIWCPQAVGYLCYRLYVWRYATPVVIFIQPMSMFYVPALPITVLACPSRTTCIHMTTSPLSNPPMLIMFQQRLPASTSAKLATTLKCTLKLDKPRHEQIYNIPNMLTFSRLIATPVVGYLIIHDQHLYAFSLFAYAAFSDLLDGWIARKWNLQTVVGSVVDPMADKFLMTTLVTCLAVNGSLPMPLAALILGRDVSLALSALYYRYASLPAPKTMARYWDFSLPSAEVHPTNISKYNTFLQLSLLGTLLCTNLLHDPSATTSAAGGLLMSIQDLLGGEEGVKMMIQGMSAIVASTTVYSGLEYTWSKKAVVILGGDEALKRKQSFRGRMIMAGGFGSFIAAAAYLWYNGQAEEDLKKQANKKLVVTKSG